VGFGTELGPKGEGGGLSHFFEKKQFLICSEKEQRARNREIEKIVKEERDENDTKS
jgi:hypothetical protein